MYYLKNIEKLGKKNGRSNNNIVCILKKIHPILTELIIRDVS